MSPFWFWFVGGFILAWKLIPWVMSIGNGIDGRLIDKELQITARTEARKQARRQDQR